MSNQEDQITTGSKTLWGTAGGQLEFVGMRFLSKQIDGRWQKFVAMEFTDHDLQAVPEESLADAGLKSTYELEFPIAN